MNYLSFCSGIGGFELALDRVFGKHARCVGFSEIDETAISVYSKHFPDHQLIGDLTKLTNKQVEDLYHKVGHIDLIVGGFPCQNLSSAANMLGDNAGLDGKQSGIFYHLLRIMKCIAKLNDEKKRKTFFMLENVRDRRNVITPILQKAFKHDTVVMTELDGSHFSAQKRVRFIWTNFPVKPVPETLNGENLQKILLPLDKVISRIDEVQHTPNMIACLNKWLPYDTPQQRGQFQAKCEEANKHGVRLCRFVDINGPKNHGVRWVRYGFSDTMKPKSLTIMNHFPNVLVDRRPNRGFIVRSFFPEEVERLFTFPVGWTKLDYDGKEVKKTQRRKLLGNSVIVDAIAYVANELKKNR